MKQVYVIPEEGLAAAIADLVPMPGSRRYYVITRINVMARFRGKGYGTRILDMILEDADKEGVTLLLEPVSSGDLSQEELIAWYTRHGFEWGAWHMKRKPQ